MQKVSLPLILVLLGALSDSNYGTCAFIPSKSRDSTGSKFLSGDKVQNVSSVGNATAILPSPSTSLSSMDENTTNLESMEFSPTEIPPKKCSPGGYPCTPDIVKMRLRNNSMYNSKEYQEPTPCCSGVCQYEEGWIDATCE